MIDRPYRARAAKPARYGEWNDTTHYVTVGSRVLFDFRMFSRDTATEIANELNKAYADGLEALGRFNWSKPLGGDETEVDVRH